MRTKKSLINMVVSFSSQIIIILLGFLSRRVLIYSVGVEYLGINGLMTNILMIFSLAESGIGTVIGYSLYEPLAKKNYEKVKSLMKLYKTSYHLLALFTLVVGILFIPFLPIFLKGNTVSDVYVIYGLFLFSSVASYLFSYKVTLNNADQNKFLSTIANTVTQVIVLIIKVFVLYYTKNYVLFLAIDIFSTITKNIIFSMIVDKRYPFLKEKNIEKLDEPTKIKITGNIKALFVNKIGYILSQCSDNLVISSLVSITQLGMYSNYTTIVTSVSGFVTLFTSSLIASMGNLIALEDKERIYSVYKKINLLNIFLYTISSVCIYVLIEPFIVWWLGDSSFIMHKSILIVTIFNFYLRGINLSVDTVKNAAGIFRPDRYVSTIEAIVNLTISILLAPKYGIAGVIFGTLMSFVLFSFWIRPYLIFKQLFVKKVYLYWINTLKAILVFILLLFVNQIVVSYLLNFGTSIVWIFICGCTSLFICLIVLILFYCKEQAFKELYQMIIGRFSKNRGN